MLPQQHRDLLILTMGKALPNQLDGQNFVTGVRPGSWAQIVPITASYANAIAFIVDAADGQKWLRDLVKALIVRFPNLAAEFSSVLAEIDRPAPVSTVANPFEEVLLAGDRPFVNRQPLRARLLDLTNQGGSTVLRVDGERQTGKTFSFYLINHVAPTKNFTVSRFKLARLPKPNELAEEILIRIGVDKAPPSIGDESAERWAEKLADIVATAIKGKGVGRLFVFDDFPVTVMPDGSVLDTPLPAGTQSFIVRLATYADEELRPYLRVVLVRFRGELPNELEEIVSRDDAQPFTATDMVAVVMQIAKARQWSLTEATAKAKIDQYHLTPGLTLNDKFKFLRVLLKELAAGTT